MASKITSSRKNIFLSDLYGKKESPNFVLSNKESWQSGRLRQS